MAICAELLYADGVGWYLSSNGATAPQPYHCDFVLAGFDESPSTPPAPVFTTEEVAALKYQAANPSPFVMSLSEGALLVSAVLGVWGIGVAVRELRRIFSGGGSTE